MFYGFINAVAFRHIYLAKIHRDEQKNNGKEGRVKKYNKHWRGKQ